MRRNDIKTTIMEYFFVNPTKQLRVREIERTLQLSLPSVIRYCKELESQKILRIIQIGSVTFYTANRSSEKYRLAKRCYNIKKLYKIGLVDYLKQKLSNPTIILFGSFLRGEDTEKSDVDLYIETPSTKKINLDKFKKLLNRDIQIITHKTIKKIKNPHLQNNIVNGTVLNGYLEVFK